MSLNAIAKQVGMSGPALYRYFASRDELITALIRDAYRSLADTVRAAFDGGADLVGLAGVIREWARANPQRYFLIYGTPAPGYHAPADTTAISDEVMGCCWRLVVRSRPGRRPLPSRRIWTATVSGTGGGG